MQFFLGKLEGKRRLRRFRRRGEGNIKTDLKLIFCENVGRIQLAQYRILWRTLLCAVFHKRRGIC
jgi:hypothetical protein